MNIIKVLILLISVDYSNSFTLQNIFTDRRSLIAGSIFSQSYMPYKEKKIEKSEIDYYAHWSIYGLVPPPIEKAISKQELINEIYEDNIISLQIAVQHDYVIATTIKNHRLSCFIKDKEFNEFVNSFRDNDNELPFTVIPIDKNKQRIRRVAQCWLGLYIVRFFAYEIPNNIKLLNECNSSMTNKQKMLYLLESQNDILEVFRNSTKS
tara:strand:- start:37 stop:660 length:624 start_codon:yes stop_codon:yes gene_type:complete